MKKAPDFTNHFQLCLCVRYMISTIIKHWLSNLLRREIYQVSYSEAIAQIQLVKEKYGNNDLFGKEKDEVVYEFYFNHLSNF